MMLEADLACLWPSNTPDDVIRFVKLDRTRICAQPDFQVYEAFACSIRCSLQLRCFC
jgi:hypothetical protein